MHRPVPNGDVHVFLLPFRPAQGVWWRRRLYMNCLPTASSENGFGSWAPGEAAVLRCPELLLQGIVPGDDALHLEPYVPAADGGLSRWRAVGAGAWSWTPGQASTRRTLGALGAASSSASRGDWTAVAYPQADRVALTAADGRSLHLQCYFPIRVAWAGDALLVSVADGGLLIFDRLAPRLGAQP
jgi:hypothetical protein